MGRFAAGAVLGGILMMGVPSDFKEIATANEWNDRPVDFRKSTNARINDCLNANMRQQPSNMMPIIHRECIIHSGAPLRLILRKLDEIRPDLESF